MDRGPDEQPIYLSCLAHELGAEVPVGELADPQVRANERLLADEGLSCCRVATATPVELAAASSALTMRAAPVDQPDAVVFCCDTPGNGTAPASVVGDLVTTIGAPATPVVAVGGSGCGNLGPGLRVARGLLLADRLSTVLLVTSDHAVGDTRYLANELTVLSDGAASCVVSSSLAGRGFRVLGIGTASKADLPSASGGLAAARAIAVGVSRAARQAFQATGVSPGDCRSLLMGNYGKAVRALLAGSAGFSPRAVHAPWAGRLAHCFGVDILYSLQRLAAAGELVPGDRLALLATGPYTWSMILVEYVEA